MTDGTATAARLERLLHVIPSAGAEDGASLSDLADALGTSPERILQDLTEVTARSFYHPAGWPDDIRIFIQPDRVRVFNPGGLERPVQLAPLETLCLAMGLRGSTAASHVRDAGARRALLRRVEAYLATHTGDEGALEPFHATALESDESEIREEVLAAARLRRTCAIVYAKPGAGDAEARVIHPYTLAYAQGKWYAVGWCAVHQGIRVFRTDRMLEACRTEHAFQIPDDFRPEDYLDDGKVYNAPDDERVRVRYSSRVARWMRERAHFQGWHLDETADGSVVLEHPVADPQWVVSHALQFGAEAEVLAPAEYRALVREVARGMAAEAR
jgi:predicted DNA-binding transcriptional regulator YafY